MGGSRQDCRLPVLHFGAQLSQPYATPPMGGKAGAKGYHFNRRREITPDGPMWEPDFEDPVFLEKLDHFLGCGGAARYDRQPARGVH